MAAHFFILVLVWVFCSVLCFLFHHSVFDVYNIYLHEHLTEASRQKMADKGKKVEVSRQKMCDKKRKRVIKEN